MVAGTKGALPFLPTLSEEEIARTLEMSPVSLDALAQTFAGNPTSRIEPPRPRSDALGRHALAALDGERTASIAGGLAMGATIGEGGMGIVRAATQRSLGRTVAVKTLRPDAKNEQATLRLLREAWVTGSLEHPNIVPVYDLGLDEDGTPIIVLKHIEGVAWSDLIADREAVKARFGADDLLEWNLRLLIQLCNAVSLAHSRGIIHRDLKPENVMIGRFGEVYLVDWGIAVSLRDDPTGRLPLASQSAEMAGTPAYMAPEMLGSGKLGEHTDVYLLGAILHEILVGRPPHAHEGFRATVASILLSRFTFPEHVPRELAAIASRAMSRAPEERFASADELRQRLEWYLRHRGSLALSADAAARVEEMRAVLSSGGDPDEVRARVDRLFVEARFGFRQALRACDDNEEARIGLRRATELVVAFYLDEGKPDAAAAALAELESPPPELAERVAEAMRAREAERRRVAELERLEAQHDMSIGRRTRFVVAAMIGLVWTFAPSVGPRLFREAEQPAYRKLYLYSLVILAIAVAIGLWGRESLTKTIVNRRALAIVLVTFLAQLALQVGAAVLGLPFPVVWVLHLYCWFVCAAACAVLVDFRLWPSALVFLGAFVFAAARPDLCFDAMSIANFSLFVNFAVAWARPREDHAFMMERMRARFRNRKETRR